MAKFSQAFLQSMTQPAYQEGLFTAARELGGLPGRRREQASQASLQKGLLGLEQMAASGQLTPEMYQEALGSYSNKITDEKSAAMIRETMGRVQQDVRATGEFESKAEINALRDRMYAVAQSELPGPEKNRRLGELQSEANTAAREGRIDPLQVGSLLREIRQDIFNQDQKKQEAQRISDRHGITLEEAEQRREKYNRWQSQGWYEDLKLEVEGQVLRDQRLKTEIRNKGLSEDQFVAQYGESQLYLHEEIQAENLERANRINDAVQQQKTGTFNYSQEDLKSLGFNEAEIKALNGSPAKQAHSAVIRRIAQIPTVAKPNAAMLGKISEALLIDVMSEKDLDFGKSEELAEGKAIASRKAIKVQELMMEGKSFEEAIADKSVSGSGSGEEVDIDAAIAVALELLQSES